MIHSGKEIQIIGVDNSFFICFGIKHNQIYTFEFFFFEFREKRKKMKRQKRGRDEIVRECRAEKSFISQLSKIVIYNKGVHIPVIWGYRGCALPETAFNCMRLFNIQWIQLPFIEKKVFKRREEMYFKHILCVVFFC